MFSTPLSNEHVKQYSSEIVKNLNFDLFGGPKSLHTYKSSSSELINQVLSDYSVNFSRNQMKSYILTYFGPTWDPKGTENLAHMGHFSHTLESTHNMPVNQVP